MTVPTIASSKVAKRMVASVTKRSNTLFVDVHAAALQCLLHAQAHGDVRLADDLVTGLHVAASPDALKAWFKMFSPITWNGDGKVGLLKPEMKTYKPFDIEAAVASPYYSFERPKTISGLTFAKLLQMAERMATTLDKKEQDGLIAEGENIEAMRSLVTAITAIAQAHAPTKPQAVATGGVSNAKPITDAEVEASDEAPRIKAVA